MAWLRTHAVRAVEHIGVFWLGLRARVTGDAIDATQLNAQLWTGAGIESASDVALLLAKGVTTDVDCREEFDDRALTAGTLLATYWAPATDDGVPKPVSWFAGAWGFAKPVLDSGGVLYAHCASGHNRGPSMAAFLLMAHWHLGKEEARALIVKARPVATLAYLDDAERAVKALGLAGWHPSHPPS